METQDPPITRIVVSQHQLQSCLDRLAGEIAPHYQSQPFTAVVVLHGAKPFAQALLLRIAADIPTVFIRAQSYYGGTASVGHVEVQGDLSVLSGKNVLLIDDIYDTGHTLKTLQQQLRDNGAMDVKTCVLLEKMRTHEDTVPVDFVGLRVADEFLIGFGLDYQGLYRDLPFIAVMRDPNQSSSNNDQ